MTEILIATKNKHKIIELQEVLSKLGYQVKTLHDYPQIEDIDETGTTFEENAWIKAKTLSMRTNQIVLADDSGLVVNALDGAPGVYSARFAGENVTYHDNNEKLRQEMVGKRDQTAYFITVMCLYRPGLTPLYFEGRLYGTIASDYKGTQGFGYDPLFVLPDGRHLAELSVAEKNQISHRAIALQKLLVHLQTN